MAMDYETRKKMLDALRQRVAARYALPGRPVSSDLTSAADLLILDIIERLDALEQRAHEEDTWEQEQNESPQKDD